MLAIFAGKPSTAVASFQGTSQYILEKRVFHVIFAGECLTAVATYQGISLAFAAIAMIETKNILLLEDNKCFYKSLNFSAKDVQSTLSNSNSSFLS